MEALPENTLIERNKSIRNDYGRIENALFFELFRFVREYEPTFELGFRNYADIEQYAEAAEYEVFCEMAKKIQRLCSEKNIYFDYNPYSDIVMDKEPVGTRYDMDDIIWFTQTNKFQSVYTDWDLFSMLFYFLNRARISGLIPPASRIFMACSPSCSHG